VNARTNASPGTDGAPRASAEATGICGPGHSRGRASVPSGDPCDGRPVDQTDEACHRAPQDDRPETGHHDAGKQTDGSRGEQPIPTEGDEGQ
jgi:hypothetical protein